MYSKIVKAAMHEIPWNAKPTFSSASVISETLYADKIDYFFHFHYYSGRPSSAWLVFLI